MVIFGASGDLTSRKLIPALFKLYCNGMFPEKFVILGVSRTFYSDESYRDKVHKTLETSIVDSKEKYCLSSFVSNIFYLAMDTADEHAYSHLLAELDSFTTRLDISPNYLFYLATPPDMYSVICRSLANENLQREKAGKYWRRIIVEKPYGRDIASAKDLDKVLTSIFKESQIYRIDHYLGRRLSRISLCLGFQMEYLSLFGIETISIMLK
jgi:Glucose-6-phosphate 1-dehydrogenase